MKAEAQSHDRILYVDANHTAASDANPGTLSEPLATLGEAVDRAVASKRSMVSTRVVVAPGTYREHVNLSRRTTRSNTTPILFEADLPGTVVVSGSDVWTDWRHEGSAFVHHWPYDWGGGKIIDRREIVAVDGRLLTQVMTRAELGGVSRYIDAPGTFYVDEAGDKLHILPPPGADMNGALVEIGVRETLWDQREENNITVRGFVFEHAVTRWSGGTAAAIFGLSSDVIVEDCTFRWNNWQGPFFVDLAGAIIRRSIMNHNGGQGWNTWHVKDFLAEDNETSYNNWRGAQGGHLGWNVGNKIESAHGLEIRRHTSVGNQSRGLWLDLDIEDAVLEELTIRDNVWDGLWIEASQGPITVRNSTIENNGRSGIRSTYAEHVTLEGNYIGNNAVGSAEVVLQNDSQIGLDGGGGRNVTNFETGVTFRLDLRNWVIRGNTVVGAGVFHHKYSDTATVIDSDLKAADWDTFLSTLESDDNTWWDPSFAAVFGYPRQKNLTFSQWQSRTGHDFNSTFSDPRGSTASTEAPPD